MTEMPGRPIVIGLTGGIGTGKSNVLQTLVSLGAEGIDADRVAHEALLPGGPAYAATIAYFGPEITLPGGEIDRRRLAAVVFADPAALSRLEALVHPAVAVLIGAKLAASQAPLVVVEAIKLIEAKLDVTICDQVWVTNCSRRQQFARLAASRGLDAAETRLRLAVQMSPKGMLSHADRVIWTGGTFAETGVQILAAWRDLGLSFPSPRVRPASLDDADGIAAVLNSVIREGGLTLLDRHFTPAQERAFLRRLPDRASMVVAQVGGTIAGFQVVEPYASYSSMMDHVGRVGTYVLSALRGNGLGRGMMSLTQANAWVAGFRKLMATVRVDNPVAQEFYVKVGFVQCGRLARQVRVDGRYVDELLFERFLDERT
jgi:dephospho-CoA kinase